MNKRYLIVIVLLVVLVGCFFLFFDKPTNEELYNKYLNKLESRESFDDLKENEDLDIVIDSAYIDNQYHYVLTFTSTITLNNFKALVTIENEDSSEYYPSFGIFDNKNINLVNDEPKDSEVKGVNLVVSNRDKVETFRVYVSYNNYEYFYSINVEG